MTSPTTDGPPAGKRPRWKKLLPLSLGPIVLGIILYSLDPEVLLDAFRGARLDHIAIACAFMLPTVLLRALRWQLLLRGSLAEMPRYRDLLAVYAHSIFVGAVTPGHVGELVKTVHLTRRGMSLGAAAASVLGDRLFDIVLLLLVGSVSLVVLVIPGLGSAPAVAGVFAVAAVGGFVTWKLVAGERVGRWLDSRASSSTGKLGKVVGKVAKLRGDFAGALRVITAPALISSALLTVIAWAATYYANYNLALSLGLDLGYFDVVALSAITTLVSLVPVTVMGAGTRDASMIVLLSRYGGTSEQAVVLSTFFLGITMFFSLVCGLSFFTPAARFELDGKGRD